MQIYIALTALLFSLSCCVRCKSIVWTDRGKKSGDWFDPENWFPEQVPGPEDDVIINRYLVLVGRPVTVKNLRVGCVNNSVAGHVQLMARGTYNWTCGYLQLMAGSNLTVTEALKTEVGTEFQTAGSINASITVGHAEIAGTFWFYSCQLTGDFNVLSTVNLLVDATVVFVGARFDCSAPLQLEGLFLLKQSSRVRINSSCTVLGGFSIQAQDDTDVVFDMSGGLLNLGPYTLSAQAPVFLGAFSAGYGATIEITNGSLTLMGEGNIFAFCDGLTTIALGPNSQLIVAAGGTLDLSDPVLLTGDNETGVIVNHGAINVSGSVKIQNLQITGAGSVSVYGSLSVTSSSFSQRRVSLFGDGSSFFGESTSIGYLGAVSGSPFVNVTIGAETYSCPEQCDEIRFPAANFRFVIGS
jgi:hypothetical protein